jgi:hypothetical protein
MKRDDWTQYHRRQTPEEIEEVLTPKPFPVDTTPPFGAEPVMTDYPLAKDPINSPSHYNQFGVECIDAIKLAVGEEGFVGYCHGNALKYLWRANYKTGRSEDFRKAAWYARMAAGDDPRGNR